MMRAAMLAVVLMSCCTIVAAQTDNPATGKSVSLIDIWFVFPDLGGIAWPYSYIRADTTDDAQRTRRKDLFKELKSLDWRLENRGYPAYRAVVAAWRSALAKVDRYRVPGIWSPAWLMAHPNQNPPVSRLRAVGACRVPSWVEVWDSAGIERVPWQPELTLSELTRDVHPVDAGASDQVAVVSPEGQVDYYGVAAWNFADTPLVPGSRVVAALPLGGESLIWIRDSIARLLAHGLPGDACREVPVKADFADG